MSRRCHHGSPRHVRGGRERFRPVASDRTPRTERALSPDRPAAVDPVPRIDRSAVEPPGLDPDRIAPATLAAPADLGTTGAPDEAPVSRGTRAAGPRAAALGAANPTLASRAPEAPGPRSAPAPRAEAAANGEDPSIERAATAPQLRRFIKSRAYVPMHELRRRFAINGGDDEVTIVELERQRLYVGLPEREGRLLGELLRGGDIGYELSMDPISPIVVGVYPMRPVTRA